PAAVFHANRVIARSPEAMAAGVQQGERRRSAQGACPELLVLDHDPDRDARAFEPIVRTIADMAPRLEVVEPGWICLAARGPSRYFGGDQAMAERMVEIVEHATGARPGVGVADGRAAASIAARRAARTPSGVIVVPPGESVRFVESFPIAWLRELGEVTPELVDLLVRLGLRTFGQLAHLDAGDVLARFGAEGLHAHRLAGGVDTRVAQAADPPPEWWIEEAFLEPVEQLETVVFVAKRLADSLVSQLAAGGRVCVRLVVIIETEHGERSERAWYRDQGMSAHAMVERVRWQLEGWANQPDGLSGGVALIRLVPDELRSDDGAQIGLWGGRSQADHDAARAIVRLCGIVGDGAVRVPMWVGGRLPTERYRWVPASSVDLDDPGDRLDRGDGPWPGGLPHPSPAVVPDPPIPAEVLDESGQVVRVNGRGEVSAPPAELALSSTRHRLVAWAGPWPVEQRWWSGDRARRLARFQVITDQGIAHLVGVEQQRWSILATYS
ncbi:DNA polymerase Y family protein, partial [Ilumatobacter sp.]|uniref:DNA polymerase Y family protein n=1 Tax=Ilumatobacter sp. TaxID=1967498 RepID=UPI003AF61BAF